MLNINISNNVDIEYPAGDTFKFAVTEDNVIDASRRLRFQVSSNGNPKMIVIEKVFYPENNAFIISLSDDDTRKLEIHKTYEYRLTYFSVEDERTTTISGSLHVQWGAPNGNILHSPSVPTLHIGKLTIEKRMDSHRTSIELDHPDGSVTAKKIANGAISEDKIADGAVTGDKIADETISEDKLNEDVIGLIDSNKFDGIMETDEIDGYEFPEMSGSYVYKLIDSSLPDDFGGILLVASYYNQRGGIKYLAKMYQTKIIVSTGEILTRQTTHTTHTEPITWSEWKSRYLTSEDVQELKAKTGYFSTSLAAGNVDYEIIAYDMTGIFGGLPVEPLSVLVSPDNVGIWESLSIVYADINGVRCKLNRSDFATDGLTANQINGYTGDKKDWFVYWYIGSDYDFNSEELNTGKYDISMAVPKFKVDEYGNMSANSLKLKYDDRAIQIVNTAEGEAIALPDSADAAMRGLKVMGKTTQKTTNGYQLFDASIVKTVSSGGATVTNNGDGSFTITGSGELTSNFSSIIELDHTTTLRLIKSGMIIMQTEQVSFPYVCAYICNESGETLCRLNNSSVASLSNTITEEMMNTEGVYMRIGFYGVAGKVITPCTIRPMLYQDGDGTWEPFTGGIPAPTTEFPCKLVSVGDDGGVDVNVHGYQLFDASAIDGKESYGVTMTNNGDGSFTVTGVANREFSTVKHYSRKEALKLLRAGQISLSNNGVYGYPYAYMSLFGTNGKYFEVNTSSATYKTKTITQEMLDDESLTMRIGIYIKNNDTTVTYLKPMLYQDGDGTWEPFKPIQTLTIPTPNGLPAVPVSEDGNYTDASGQQWVCDEIDYNRGVYIKRVGEWKYFGGAVSSMNTCTVQSSGDILTFNQYVQGVSGQYSGNGNVLCNAFMSGDVAKKQNVVGIIRNTNDYLYFGLCASDLGFVYGDGKSYNERKTAVTEWMQKTFSEETPLIVNYPLIEPTETSLSEAEINAYKELYTHYPHTSIHNSKNAHMAVDYVADTKNYVDNQIKKEVAELTAAILTQ